MILIFLFAMVGMVAHWVKRWANGQTTATMWEFFFVNEKKRSIAAAVTCTVAIVTFLQTWDGVLSSVVLYTAFLTGYASDSMANEG